MRRDKDHTKFSLVLEAILEAIYRSCSRAMNTQFPVELCQAVVTELISEYRNYVLYENFIMRSTIFCERREKVTVIKYNVDKLHFFRCLISFVKQRFGADRLDISIQRKQFSIRVIPS